MTGQLLIDHVNRFPESQLSLPIPELGAPNLFNDEECETLWDRVNRICDQYILTQRKHRAHCVSAVQTMRILCERSSHRLMICNRDASKDRKTNDDQSEFD